MSILKTILFLVVLYLLIKVVSNMFLPGKKKKSKIRFFYRTFKNVRDQQEKQQERRQQNKKPEERLDEIEEAEYEDVTEDDGDKYDSNKNK